MKLLLMDYLASLKEREELDAILPDLLSQMGMNVFTKPARGTRQDGVDVGAVGKDENGIESVFLFSIKSEDVTRACWDDNSNQSLRRSLNEIRDAFIRNRLPRQHQNKPIIICVCCGGVVREDVRPLVEGYFDDNTSERIRFQEWNGDKLAGLIQEHFLREEMFKGDARRLLRKSIAMIEEPEVSVKYFYHLFRVIVSQVNKQPKSRLTAIRQLSFCVWILFAWSRESKNVEAVYLGSERAMLQAWELVKPSLGKNTLVNKKIVHAFANVQHVYFCVSYHYLENSVLPHADKLYALSNAVRPVNDLDVNLRLFDVIGRLSLGLIWLKKQQDLVSVDEKEYHWKVEEQKRRLLKSIKDLIWNNPILFSPAKDEQVVDISLTALALVQIDPNSLFLSKWLNEMLDRLQFCFRFGGKYPVVLNDYLKLVEHSQKSSEEEFKKATCSSVLYPTLALISVIINDVELNEKIRSMSGEFLNHSDFQLWFPDENSEENIYLNREPHGICLTGLFHNQTGDEFLEVVNKEMKESLFCHELSAFRYGFWPLILVACRHYRFPVSPHFFVMGSEPEENEDESK